MTSKVHISGNTPDGKNWWWELSHPRKFLEKFFKDEVPGEEVNILKNVINLGCSTSINVYAYGDHIFVDNLRNGSWNCSNWMYRELNIEVIDADPFIKAEVIGNAFEKMETFTKQKSVGYGYYGRLKDYEVTEKASYVISGDRYNNTEVYETYKFLKIRLTADGIDETIELPFKRPRHGHIDASKSTSNSLHVDQDFFGFNNSWKENLSNSYYGSWNCFGEALNDFEVDDYIKVWELFLHERVGTSEYVDRKSIKSIENKKTIKPNLERLEKEEPVLFNYFLWLHDGKISGGVSNNQLLAAWLKTVGEDYDQLKESLEKVFKTCYVKQTKEGRSYPSLPEQRDMCLMFDEAKEKDRAKREHKEWYLRKTNAEKADGLGCNKDTYPLTHTAIESGDLPINLFHDPCDKLKAVNTEWGIWEKALKRDGWSDVLFSIAQSASGRTTYDKDVTPYISFLFRIEKYLDRHAPRPKVKGSRKKVGWKAMPKFVESQWYLEMESGNENGTVNKRSALTPLPDNESGTIEVPYAAMAIHGRQTTYCYSQYYCLFEEGYLDYETKTPVVNELEVGLNGRDDYGLMYYTLTGSPTNRGYPTFLTIFERRKDFTHVHFHRVHPNKYKDGRPVPACKLIEECYRYMAGNVRAEEIHAQQGDMIFIRCEEPKKWSKDEMKGISDFESHAFVVPEGSKPVLLLENKSKTIKNRLGHILSNEDFVVQHPEHEDLTNMPSGWYEVRRCKSWEANPTAIWSFTID